MNTIPTRSMRGAITAACSEIAAGLHWAWLNLAAIVVLVLAWLLANFDGLVAQTLHDQVDDFDESTSSAWAWLMVVGAVVGFITLAGLWGPLLSSF